MAYGISIGVLQEVIWKAKSESRAWLTHVSAWSAMISCAQHPAASALGSQGLSSPASQNVRKPQWKSRGRKIVIINRQISIAAKGNQIAVCPAALIPNKCISKAGASSTAYPRVCFDLWPPLLPLKKGTYWKRRKSRNFSLSHCKVWCCP